MVDLASAIRRVEPRHTAKLISRDLCISLQHAKRIIAGDIPQSRHDEVCRWVAERLERKLEELARVQEELRAVHRRPGGA